MTPALTLYHFPGACSQVSRCALEWAEVAYRLELVNLSVGAQANPDYTKISPLRKVPVLLIDGVPLAENAAIIVYVAALRPQAALFPPQDCARDVAEAQAGLSFCGATLHPSVRGLLNPLRLTTGDTEAVRARSTELLANAFAYAEHRLEDRGWWLGERSIIDVYLNWAFATAVKGCFDPTSFPRLSALSSRLMELSPFARVIGGEAEAIAALGL